MMGILTPAVQAYGVPVLIVMAVFTLAMLVWLAVDYRNHSRQWERAAAKRRHPASRGRHPLIGPNERPTQALPPVSAYSTPLTRIAQSGPHIHAAKHRHAR